MPKKRAKTRVSSKITIHFSVYEAEAGGWRYGIERQGRISKGSRKIRTLESKWFKTKAEAEKGLKKARKRWTGKI